MLNAQRSGQKACKFRSRRQHEHHRRRSHSTPKDKEKKATITPNTHLRRQDLEAADALQQLVEGQRVGPARQSVLELPERPSRQETT